MVIIRHAVAHPLGVHTSSRTFLSAQRHSTGDECRFYLAAQDHGSQPIARSPVVREPRLPSFKTRLVFAITASPLGGGAAATRHKSAVRLMPRVLTARAPPADRAVPRAARREHDNFRTFLCDTRFVEDKSVSFLEADLTLSCESTEYKQLEFRLLAFCCIQSAPTPLRSCLPARDAIQHRDGRAEHLGSSSAATRQERSTSTVPPHPAFPRLVFISSAVASAAQ